MRCRLYSNQKVIKYFYALRMREVKASARMRKCTGSAEPPLLAVVICTNISCAGLNKNCRFSERDSKCLNIGESILDYVDFCVDTSRIGLFRISSHIINLD